MGTLNTMPPLTPSTHVKLPLGVWLALTFSIATSVSGVLGNHLVFKARLADHERRLIEVETALRTNRDLLMRIDERTVEIKRQVERLAR